MGEIYLNAVLLARTWVENARDKNSSAESIAMYERLLDRAIDQYNEALKHNFKKV